MLWGMAVAAVMIGQPHKAEKPMALDPVKQRQVYEAFRTANEWAEGQAHHLYPGKIGIRLPRNQQPLFVRKRNIARHYLTIAAAKQICEAYDIDRKTLESVLRDPRSKNLKFFDEPAENGVKMANSLQSMMRPTRFDPWKVVLPEKVASQIGYKNPSPDGPPKNFAPSAYMPDGRRIPGRRTNPEEEARREEIAKRAAQAEVKDPVPLGPSTSPP